jgi:hypothetical protein
MTTRRQFVQSIPALAAGIVLAKEAVAAAQSQDAPKAQGESSWHSPSLTNETVTAQNGAITTRAASEVNKRMGVTGKTVDEVVKGVYHLRGWGIANSIAIDSWSPRISSRTYSLTLEYPLLSHGDEK